MSAVPRSTACRPVFARRMIMAFVFLALGMGAALGLAAHFSFEYLGSYLVGWHARPVMETLIEAEKRAWEAEDSGRDQLYYGEDLVTAMHWTFLVGKQVSPQWRDLPDGLHFMDDGKEFVLIERREGVEYALKGGTGAFQALKSRFNGILLLCALAGLAVAVVLAVVLSRRLTGPLRRLTLAVESRAPGSLSFSAESGGEPPSVGTGGTSAMPGLCGPPATPGTPGKPAKSAKSGSSGACPQSTVQTACSRQSGPAPAAAPPLWPHMKPAPVPMTDMDDEVGVLARAIAAREEALYRFVQRESHFTGDVSHELRTPLTVMQGGLEVLEARLQHLTETVPQAQELVPVVGRLLRTTSGMSRTVRTLLLLARRPGEIEASVLDCSVILRDIIAEMAREGLAHPVELAHMPFRQGADCLPALLALLDESALPGTVRGTPAPETPSGPRAFGPVSVALAVAMSAPVPVCGQKELIGVIFKNLLDNARQYAENGRAFVVLEPDRMLVGNRGRIVRHVDVFSRGVSRTCKKGQQSPRDGAGNGLGLSLAQRACERLGWRLELAPLPADADGMTVFSLVFPPAAQGEDV